MTDVPYKNMIIIYGLRAFNSSVWGSLRLAPISIITYRDARWMMQKNVLEFQIVFFYFCQVLLVMSVKNLAGPLKRIQSAFVLEI